VWVDAVRAAEALGAVEALVAAGQGGAVFTPNVDHVVVADQLPAFGDAYARAELSICDGQPLRWASPLVGLRLPERVPGSDLLVPLMTLAAKRGWRVYLLGGGPGVVEEASERLRRELGVTVVGVSAPRIGLTPDAEEDALVARVAATRPDLVITCLGAPKGELWIDRVRDRLRPAVAIQLGASLDFYLGRVRRAPAWMQRSGLEWLYRLLQEPRRLAYRYLVQDPRFVVILLRTLLQPRSGRVLPPSPAPGEARRSA
jgi:N-acetylglucosaminyldiphosphoundecaprenol N-acetyl-beta-D-mannosaminyltransferase